jgi:2,4-dienoyl-CoA reductase (NADPH2)
MARPFLADPEIVNKAAEGREEEINTCIGCNQACLDHTFKMMIASCLVNPVAGYELDLKITPVRTASCSPSPSTRGLSRMPQAARDKRMKVAVVGAGPAGLAAACTAAERGHKVRVRPSRSPAWR